VARWLGVGTVTVEGSPTGGGWSNETIFVRADGRALVVRLTPADVSMFPTYDLAQQVRCLQLAAAAQLPVPVVIGFEPESSVLGRPFFVMERLAGRVPADDDPPFTKAGFVFDASEAEQRRLCETAVDHIAAVQGIEAPAFLTVGPTPADHLAWCAELCRWAGIGHPDVLATHAALAATVPPAGDAPSGLLWGDARPANMVLDDHFGIVGLLDWELAGTGPGELDLAWFLEMNRMRTTGMDIPPLPGWMSDDATWARWSANIGREATHVDWYLRYNAYKVAVLLFLYLRVMIDKGRLPAGHRLMSDNLATRRLRQFD
jgi:aminoglycoside phosphotransferase (APT) family kinase protein